MNQMLLNYSYLQILDFLTTIAFLVNGVKEANPLVRYALEAGPSPISGLIAVKIAAVGGALPRGVSCRSVHDSGQALPAHKSPRNTVRQYSRGGTRV